MKICHISDSHLGAGENHPRRGASGLTLRQEDIINSFKSAIDMIIEEKPDICVHAGDIFHTVRPTNKIIAIAGEQLARLAKENNIPTVIISGNHDAPKQPHIGAALDIFSHIDNLYISAGTGLQTFTIQDTKLFALPHCLTPAIQKDELANCIPDPAYTCNILIMHGVAAGMPEFSMVELGEQELPLESMEPFDYTALGHYHNFTSVAPRAYYAGSTDRLSQAEREHDKGFVVVIFNPFQVEFRKVNCRPMVDIEPVDASGLRGDQLAEIIQQKVTSVGADDKIIRLKVTNVTEETLKTVPSSQLADLKQNAYSLQISFEKDKSAQKDAPQFEKQGIGQIDKGFIEFLETVDLKGFDKERLIKSAMHYLADS